MIVQKVSKLGAKFEKRAGEDIEYQIYKDCMKPERCNFVMDKENMLRI